MRLAKFAGVAAVAISLTTSALSAATPVRASGSRIAPISGVSAGVIKASNVRASKRVGQEDSLLGAPLLFIFLGAAAITIGAVVITNNNGSN